MTIFMPSGTTEHASAITPCNCKSCFTSKCRYSHHVLGSEQRQGFSLSWSGLSCRLSHVIKKRSYVIVKLIKPIPEELEVTVIDITAYQGGLPGAAGTGNPDDRLFPEMVKVLEKPFSLKDIGEDRSGDLRRWDYIPLFTTPHYLAPLI
jgi:hypothetical protein